MDIGHPVHFETATFDLHATIIQRWRHHDAVVRGGARLLASTVEGRVLDVHPSFQHQGW